MSSCCCLLFYKKTSWCNCGEDEQQLDLFNTIDLYGMNILCVWLQWKWNQINESDLWIWNYVVASMNPSVLIIDWYVIFVYFINRLFKLFSYYWFYSVKRLNKEIFKKFSYELIFFINKQSANIMIIRFKNCVLG